MEKTIQLIGTVLLGIVLAVSAAANTFVSLPSDLSVSWQGRPKPKELPKESEKRDKRSEDRKDDRKKEDKGKKKPDSYF